jgi:hypothetical protein
MDTYTFCSSTSAPPLLIAIASIFDDNRWFADSPKRFGVSQRVRSSRFRQFALAWRQLSSLR